MRTRGARGGRVYGRTSPRPKLRRPLELRGGQSTKIFRLVQRDKRLRTVELYLFLLSPLSPNQPRY